MSRDPNCIFCKIVSVQVPAAVVYEDDTIICFLDVNPLAPGHLLVVTRDHFTKLTDVPTDVSSKIGAILPVAGRAALEVTGAPGFNVLNNEGKVAGQVVQHVHFHIIPRNDGDGIGYRWRPRSYPEGEAAKLQAAFQTAIGRHK